MENKVKQSVANFMIMVFNANEVKLGGAHYHIDFSGHVNMLSFRISNNDPSTIFSDSIWIDGDLYNEDEFAQTLEKWKNEIKNCLESNIVFNEC